MYYFNVSTNWDWIPMLCLIVFFSCNYYSSCPVNSEDPIPCRNGTFAPARSTYCHPCPIGSHCPSEKLSFHLPCTNGSFSVAENSTICTECPAGSKCPNPALGPVECEDGMYSKSGATHCIECPSGHGWEIILLVWFTWFWLTCFLFIKLADGTVKLYKSGIWKNKSIQVKFLIDFCF